MRSWAAELGRGTTVSKVAPGPGESDVLASMTEDVVEGRPGAMVGFFDCVFRVYGGWRGWPRAYLAYLRDVGARIDVQL